MSNANALRRASEPGDASGIRSPVDPIAMMASGRGDSQKVRRRLLVLLVGADQDDLEHVVTGFDLHRYELRFTDLVGDVAEEINHQIPDVLILDESADQQGSHDLLETLSRSMRAPVVVMLTENAERPSLARLFGLPSVQKPVNVEQLRAAIEVALEQNLRPLPRRIGE